VGSNRGIALANLTNTTENGKAFVYKREQLCNRAKW